MSGTPGSTHVKCLILWAPREATCASAWSPPPPATPLRWPPRHWTMMDGPPWASWSSRWFAAWWARHSCGWSSYTTHGGGTKIAASPTQVCQQKPGTGCRSRVCAYGPTVISFWVCVSQSQAVSQGWLICFKAAELRLAKNNTLAQNKADG